MQEMAPDTTTIEQIAQALRSAERIVAFTGAGISTESGIPDYRGPQGKWTTGKVPHIDDVVFDPESRARYWRERASSFPFLQSRVPNAGHQALAALHARGILAAVITQNIDGLHQKSGIPDDIVIELHGSEHRLICLDHGHSVSADDVQALLEAGETDPRCPLCGAGLRASTVLFGEQLPLDALRVAQRVAHAADLMLVIGSSLVVNPAAMLPVIAKDAGAKLIIVNREPTPLDELADIVARSDAGATMSGAIDALNATEDAQ